MFVQGLIPLFLIAHIPLENDGYGPEYIFTVNMDIVWMRENINPFGFRVFSRLHCIPKRHESNILSCSLRHTDSIDFGRNKWDDDFNWRKNVTNEPIELVFDKKGIEKMIVSQQIKTYDLNILKLVAEQLHTGNDFSNVHNGRFEDVAQSVIGTCNVVFEITHRFENTVTHDHDFELHLQPSNLHLKHGKIVIIDKTTDLNNCTCYAENYYCKYGDTVVCENQVDLRNMTSHMEISDVSFVSSTIRKGTAMRNFEMYDVEETITVTLEDIQLATRDPPTIMNPGRTKIFANYDVKSDY